jgi:hypothetical protein
MRIGGKVMRGYEHSAVLGRNDVTAVTA